MGTNEAARAALAEPAANNATPATLASKSFFIGAPKVSGLNQAVASPNEGRESNGKYRASRRFWFHVA